MKTISQQTWPASFHWWIDNVGGFLTFTKPVVRIGQAGHHDNDMAILGDLSAHHAEIRRTRTGFLLIAHAETTVNGNASNTFLLRDGDRIRMRSVELEFRQPVLSCSTARLKLVSRHRLPISLDGVLLLGETCILGPGRDAHVRTPWPANLFLNWYQDRYWVRGPGRLKIDGQEYQGCGPLNPDSDVRGSWGRFRLEPPDS